MLLYRQKITNGEHRKGGILLSVAEKLVILRGNKTQKRVADDLGMAQSTYAMYENGKRVPSDERKKKIANYFNVTVQSIFFDE